MSEKKYLSVTETAKLLRKALKAAHPGVKFSVRSSSYSGGASIRVGWTDGPTAAEVDKTANLYRGATFDGMVDMKSYHDSLLANEDGTVELVHFGADFVFTERSESAEFRAEVAENLDGLDVAHAAGDSPVCEVCRLAKPDSFYVDRPAGGFYAACRDDAAVLVARLYTREEVAA
jgi:hypothetical protein